MSLYEPLYRHLASQTAETVQMSYMEIERLLGRKLPPTARGDHARQWWANTDTHVQAKAWLKASRKAKLDFNREQVEFLRIRPPPSFATSAKPETIELSWPALHPAAIRLIEDMAEESNVDLGQAAVKVLNQIALRRRRETLDWFAQNTTASEKTSADLIRDDRDGR